MVEDTKPTNLTEKIISLSVYGFGVLLTYSGLFWTIVDVLSGRRPNFVTISMLIFGLLITISQAISFAILWRRWDVTIASGVLLFVAGIWSVSQRGEVVGDDVLAMISARTIIGTIFVVIGIALIIYSLIIYYKYKDQ